MNDDRRRFRIRLQGSVQGVGFRPFVWNRASAIDLTGWVANDSFGVIIEVQGSRLQLDAFLDGFASSLPPLAIVDSLAITEIPLVEETHFVIRDSEISESMSTPIAADISICDDCLGELRDPADRRFRYPFINCTNCGPRFTIIQDIPYDRPLTTMKSFEMCDSCRHEYDDPSNRRFHAQPNACPRCGPQIWFAKANQNLVAPAGSKESNCRGEQAIEDFMKAIAAGQIVAVKGIGGFHLVCDATNPQVIRRLRERKGRTDKPFAMMVSDSAQATSFAIVGARERQLLESRQRPIVLLRKCVRDGQRTMLQHVAPGNDFVGVMLPYSPLHYLLAGAAVPLVMTSGNRSDEPIARSNDEALERLASLADCFLFHNREIHVVCDDSVVRCVDDTLLPIRRSRGFAPMPVKLTAAGPSVLAIGGEIKAAFCVTKDDYAYISQHIGDVGNIETLDALQRNVEHFVNVFRVDINAVAADLHPGYLSAQWAKKFAELRDIPLITVQHHSAHAAALAAEHQWPATRPLLVVCFDGTGYGTDQAIWGGEFLLASGHRHERIAHLKYFPLPGGDASIRWPYRTALSLLWASGQPWDERLACVAACPPAARRILQQQLIQQLNCASTSSVGRLFDAIASIIGVRHEVNYEAQAAMELEALAAEFIDDVNPAGYEFEIDGESPLQIGWGNITKSICHDTINGVAAGKIAAQFHHAVANLVADSMRRSRQQWGIQAVGLTGGVFQNALLLRLVKHRLTETGFDVLTHAIMPPNDGGLALGQAMVARHALTAASNL